MIGQTISHFKITAKLGEGGMGEVYRAEDKRLGRAVAIKVLPDEFASDPERLARFEQEARAAAALNHPNIAVVHDIGVEGSTHFIVQEFLDGKTLRELMQEGTPPLSRALAIGMEVAKALAAAHAAGIVHRDLKPENIFVTSAGHAKVLDFGLAKLAEGGGSRPASGSLDPTALATAVGQVMGTAGYMAPEQIEGRPDIDGRADLFALGCVLYELVTGQRAFDGDNVHETLSNVLKTTPPTATTIRPELPATLAWILDKSLAKDPALRYQSAGDAVVDLQRLAAAPNSGVVVSAVDRTPFSRRPATLLAWAVAAGALLLLIGGLIGRSLAPSPDPQNRGVVRFDLLPGSVSAVYNRVLAISPDGSMMVHTSTEGLWLRHRDRSEPQLLAGTLGGRTPFFSPDGKRLGFWAHGGLRWTSVDGESPVGIGPPLPRPVGVSWGGDGMIYVGQGEDGITRVDPHTGNTESVVTVEAGELAHGPELLPGNDWLMFAIASSVSAWDDSPIVAQSLSSGERRALVDGGREPRYLPGGYLLFVRDGMLYAAGIDLDSMATVGVPERVATDVAVSNRNVTGAANYDVSDTGTLFYQVAGPAQEYEVRWQEGESVELLPFGRRPFASPALSPDGARVAFEMTSPLEGTAIWLFRTDQESGTRLVEGGENRIPVWSPDGQWIYFASDRSGNFDIWRQRADLSGEAELVFAAPGDQSPIGVSGDWEWLYLVQMRPNNSDILRVRLDGTGEPEELAATQDDEPEGSLSPDGRFLAYSSQETDDWKIYVLEIQSGRRWVVGPGGYWPRWARDGSRVAYLLNDGVYSVEFLWEDDWVRSAPSLLTPLTPGDIVQGFDLTEDGRRVLTIELTRTENALPSDVLRVVINWIEELRESS